LDECKLFLKNSRNVRFIPKIGAYEYQMRAPQEPIRLCMPPASSFTFIDLFAGLGGFHAALKGMGGECVYASEIDPAAAKIYEQNWGKNPLNDITKQANDEVMNVPPHDVLCAGFPCQPFSKSGAQKGMDETRGTLYWNILKIVQTHHPRLVILENVRNLAGPRHTHEWETIISTLRAEGYLVSTTPAVFSPHLLPPHLGGKPQNRERVFITATYVGDTEIDSNEEVPPPVDNKPVEDWDKNNWNIKHHIPLESQQETQKYKLNKNEVLWLEAWEEFVQYMWKQEKNVPNYPIWVDAWGKHATLKLEKNTPAWKQKILQKNIKLYNKHQKFLDSWKQKWNMDSELFPPSRRKLEWQAQDSKSIWDTILHFRPSGIRTKKPTYTPALVAITQTTILGKEKRRLSPRETARLQGFPDDYSFDGQKDSATYKQTGNSVNIGVVWHVVKQHVQRDKEILENKSPKLLNAIQSSPKNPYEVLNKKQ
jgi:DNA (cytosine-5)-methyltransferase 1